MKEQKLEIVAHRGLSQSYPENTLPAFKAAAALELYAIEFDVHLTRDGVPVVTHDDTVDRCSNGHGRVDGFSSAEISRLDFGGWKAPDFAGLRLPTLTETLDTIWAVNPAMRLLVEIKEDDPACARKVLAELQHYRRPQQWMMTSFHPEILKLLRQMAPDCLLHCSEDEDLPFDPGRYEGVNSIGLGLSVVTPERVARLKQLGLRVDAWVVDTASQLQQAQACGVDGITSNAADKIIKMLDQEKK